MKKRIGFKTLKSRLTFWFLLVALIPLIAVSTVISLQRTRVIKENAFHKLTAIRDLKVDQLNNWIDERISDLRAISLDREIRAISEALNEKATEKNIRIIRHATELLNHYVAAYKAYEELFIINPLTGKIEVSTKEARIGTDKSKNTNFTEPMRTGEAYIKDIYYSKTIQRPTMTFSLPIYGEGESIAGILVARIDLAHSLYELLLERAGMGNTGETLIINQDVVALNELRWYPDAPLKLNIKARPAVMASQGKTGITETPDYRGEEVLAAYTFIPQARWGFVAKQDLKEIYAPVQAMFIHILVVVLISAVMVYFLALFVARIFARPVLEMTETSRKIQEGDLTARNRIESNDEIGFLADSFNNLADSMGSQIQVQGSVAHVSDTMVGARDITGFAGQLLKTLVETTGSNMGAFYLLASDGARFEHCASMGVNPELLEPFDASASEGELGKAALTREISHIKEIPEDTIFTFRTFTGTVLPKEMITVPLLIDEKVAGVISLAALQPYSKDAMEILNQIWQGINTALSNLFASEETRELAEQLLSKNQELEAQTEELQAQTEELQAMSDELQQRSEELQEQNVELEAQRHQVEEANRLKSEFLSNMSHELRTPLNSVMALSRVLIMQSKEKLSEEEAGYLEIIERNGKRLLSLINDILDLSKIEAGKMDLSPRSFSLGGTIEAIMENLGPISGDKGLEMIQEISPDLPRIESDEERVHQILQNLIGNAVKFTDEGSVTVSAKCDEETFYVRVQDTGIGISEKDLSRIFEEFRQVDGTSSRQYEGTGLGLAIANKAARILGGGIIVESTLGKGSTFSLTLPILWKGPLPEGEPLTARVSREFKPEQRTILVVDDEPEVVTLIAGFVSSQGYNVITALSGREALELAKSHHPFAITLDIIMPGMDGWEVLERLKQDPDTADIPVIVASVTDDRQTGFALGAVGYITKPVNRDVLIGEINKIGRPGSRKIMVVDDNEIDRRP
ncbi:MAG: response regulator [Deltaproteobacteria bacterium]|nr:response regulator [Deltaproteobacteria bacterium]